MENNITFNDEPLKEYLEKVETNNINTNYKEQVGSMSKQVHKPIITRKHHNNYKDEVGEVKVLSKKEIIEQYGKLPIDHNNLIKNIFEVLLICGPNKVTEISNILKKPRSSVSSIVSVIQKKTGDKIIKKEGKFISMADDSLSAEEAYNLLYPKKTKSEIDYYDSIKPKKENVKEVEIYKSSNDNESINININIDGPINKIININLNL